MKRLLCRIGVHKFGAYTIREVVADIFIARTKCERCPREIYGDPCQVHSVFFAPGELQKMGFK